MDRLRLSVGIDSFEKLRTSGCYYIDKTKFIEELLQDRFEVNLITRPRRFGKTLAMSMLADFFDIRKDSRDIFKGLEVAENKKLCEKWMNQWPVLSLTLKNVEGLNFINAYGLLKNTVADLCIKHSYLAESDKVDASDKEIFEKLKYSRGDAVETKSSLYVITRMMCMHYGKPVILLIDEYDVPLAMASEHGYYVEMLDMLRGLIGMPLKTNEFLQFAVVTGCLRIAKESIFTGTNNFVSSSVMEANYSDYFGFTKNEVLRLLKDTGFENQMDKMKIWYDGYRFGNQEIYCPWDVLNHVRRLQKEPSAEPENYWKNTSHNGIVRSFIDRTDLMINDKIETLLSGGCILEQITEDLTYDTLHSSESNLWSVLYLTGYLTQAGRSSEKGRVYLKIPNEEIKSIFADTVSAWFSEGMKRADRRQLFDALWSGNEKMAKKLITDLLFDTISYFDYREDYYHAFLAGIFAGAGYAVESNKEYGLGRPDIVVRDKKSRRVMIIEVKHSNTEQQMKEDAEAALVQIDVRQYTRQFLKGYHTILCYGMAFFEKECVIKSLA